MDHEVLNPHRMRPDRENMYSFCNLFKEFASNEVSNHILFYNFTKKYIMAEEHIVKILSVESVTHNVKRFKVEKPEGYTIITGQATEVDVNKEWKKDETHH